MHSATTLSIRNEQACDLMNSLPLFGTTRRSWLTWNFKGKKCAMRPVEKGLAPGPFASYGEALPELWARLGRFCSYCGRHIPSGLAVEHKRPRTRYPQEVLLWSNFLLGCLNCNS